MTDATRLWLSYPGRNTLVTETVAEVTEVSASALLIRTETNESSSGVILMLNLAEEIGWNTSR
jgi:hypothetical protein